MANRPEVVSMIVPPAEKALLAQIAEIEDRSMSATVRQLIQRRAVELGMLPPAEMPVEYQHMNQAATP